MLRIVLLAFAAASLGWSVRAQDLAYMAQGHSWNGFYVGGHCGIARATSKNRNNDAGGGYDPVGVDFVTHRVEDTAAACGLQSGYNWQRGQTVLGIEGELSWSGIDRNLPGPGPDDGPDNLDDRNALKHDWVSTLTARVGMAQGRTLLYAKGGAALARITNVATDTSGPALLDDPSDIAQTTRNRWGWALGVGMEYTAGPNWSIKAEYLYHDFGRGRSVVNGDGETFGHRNRLHSVKVGANYRW